MQVCKLHSLPYFSYRYLHLSFADILWWLCFVPLQLPIHLYQCAHFVKSNHLYALLCVVWTQRLSSQYQNCSVARRHYQLGSPAIASIRCKQEAALYSSKAVYCLLSHYTKVFWLHSFLLPLASFDLGQLEDCCCLPIFLMCDASSYLEPVDQIKVSQHLKIPREVWMSEYISYLPSVKRTLSCFLCLSFPTFICWLLTYLSIFMFANWLQF